MTRTDKVGSQQLDSCFTLVGAHQHCVAKICVTPAKEPTHINCKMTRSLYQVPYFELALRNTPRKILDIFLAVFIRVMYDGHSERRTTRNLIFTDSNLVPRVSPLGTGRRGPWERDCGDPSLVVAEGNKSGKISKRQVASGSPRKVKFSGARLSENRLLTPGQQLLPEVGCD